jgi:DNA-binding transcriptional ArsR family regulator
MRDFLVLAKAVADESRLRVICALKGRELCVCQIIGLLGLAPSTVSKHMSILHQARLVDCRKDGRWSYYRLAGDDAPETVRDTLSWVATSLSASPRIRQDAKSLRRILKCDPETLCQRQHRSGRSFSSARATRAAARWPKAGRGI